MPVAKTAPLHSTSETDGIKENGWGLTAVQTLILLRAWETFLRLGWHHLQTFHQCLSSLNYDIIECSHALWVKLQ